MLKTKIVCTLGPASNSPEMIEKMMLTGMNVARLNFSHGTHEEHKKVIDRIKEARERLGIPCAIMLDTKGPEIRLGKFEGGNAELATGSQFTLVTSEVMGNSERATISYKDLPKQITAGCRILLNDGAIELAVTGCDEESIVCTVVAGGIIKNGKGVNIPNVHLDMPHLSDRDKSDLLFGIENGVDFIAASFMRTGEDVIGMRKFVDYNGGHEIRIISKIENLEGIENFDEILKYSDGIMVARGDMGVEVDFERLPGLQKRFIKKCYQAGKMVITATQMLESMIENPTPTRAEISDVANAVFDGTSAVMLSGETAAGKYPLRAVKAMARIAEQAEKDAFEGDAYGSMSYDIDYTDVTNISYTLFHGIIKIKTSSKTGFTLVCYSFENHYISLFLKSQTKLSCKKYIGCYFHTHLHEKPEYSILFRMCIQLRLCCNPFFNSPRLNCRWIIVKLVFCSLDSK